MFLGSCSVSCAITILTFSSIPPALVPVSPQISTTGKQVSKASMITSAPLSTSISLFFAVPAIWIFPAGITLDFTSPLGVFITTADLFPINALEIGTIIFVSSEVSLNKVAIPYGFDSIEITFPFSATSNAVNIFTGIFSKCNTSSTIGIFLFSLLFIRTASSF